MSVDIVGEQFECKAIILLLDLYWLKIFTIHVCVVLTKEPLRDYTFLAQCFITLR